MNHRVSEDHWSFTILISNRWSSDYWARSYLFSQIKSQFNWQLKFFIDLEKITTVRRLAGKYWSENALGWEGVWQAHPVQYVTVKPTGPFVGTALGHSPRDQSWVALLAILLAERTFIVTLLLLWLFYGQTIKWLACLKRIKKILLPLVDNCLRRVWGYTLWWVIYTALNDQRVYITHHKRISGSCLPVVTAIL